MSHRAPSNGVLRAVLFDLDDTLVDQARAASAAVVVWAAEHGVHDDEVAARWAAICEVHYARYQRREVTFAEQRRARVREFLSLGVGDDDADTLFAAYLRRYEAGWATFDDAVPALRRARAAGLIVVVFTNGDEDQQRHKLRSLGLENEVDMLVASSSLPAGKPDPRAFRGALERVGTRPGETLMVGDSLEKDVRGAVHVGLPAILLDRHGQHPAVDVPTVASLDDVRFSGASSGR